MGLFDFFTKRKQKHSVSVDAVKEQTKMVLERLEKVESELSGLSADSDHRKTEGKTRDSAKDRYEERQQQMLRPIHDMAVDSFFHCFYFWLVNFVAKIEKNYHMIIIFVGFRLVFAIFGPVFADFITQRPLAPESRPSHSFPCDA